MLLNHSKKQNKHLTINTLEKVFFKLLLLFFLGNLISVFSSSTVFGQSDTTAIEDSSLDVRLDSTLSPKKIKSKVSIGLRGGITRGMFEIANPEEADENAAATGSMAMLFINYRIKPSFSIQSEITSGRYRSNNTLYRTALRQGRVDYTLSTIDLNLIGVYSYPIKNWLSISAEAGFSVSYLHNAFGKVIAPNSLGVGSYDVNSDNQFEKLNYGAIVGISPSVKLKGNVLLQASIRYRHGLNNINTFDYKLNRYLADEERTIQTRDVTLQIGFLFPIYRNVKRKIIEE